MLDVRKTLCSLLLTASIVAGLTATLFPTTTYAQAVSGEITGSVTDPTGAAVGGAQVTATNVVTGVVTTEVTNSSGLYNFSELLAGTYDVTVTASGFSKSVLKGVLVELNHTLSENIALKLAGSSTNVEVVALA